MSDDELDRDWKPNGRPQSTMARSFSAALNDLFKMDNSLADLDAAVSEKKRAVSFQTSELEALEARLRATEERLKQTRAMTSARVSGNGNGPASPRRNRAPLNSNTFESQGQDERQYGQQQGPNSTSPLSAEFRPKTPTRPGTSKSSRRQEAPPMPGAPPTPGASEGDYTVPNSDASSERISADYVIVDQDGEDFPPRRDSRLGE